VYMSKMLTLQLEGAVVAADYAAQQTLETMIVMTLYFAHTPLQFVKRVRECSSDSHGV
jgi:hypothetical protein